MLTLVLVMNVFKQIFFCKDTHFALALLLSAENELSHVSAFFAEFFQLLTWLITGYLSGIFRI